MYILYTKIELQTNTHIPITPSPHRKHSSSPTYTKHITHNNKNEVGIPYPLFQTHQLSHTVQMTLTHYIIICTQMHILCKYLITVAYTTDKT